MTNPPPTKAPAPVEAPTLPYEVVGDHPDELLAADGTVRPAWSHVASALAAMGSTALRERALDARRIIRSDGATFNLHGAGSRPWAYDPVPFLLGSDEWAAVEAGLQERAEVLDLALADIYSSRSLVTAGILSPELILASPDFLRVAVDVIPPSGTRLVFHAADLVRGPEGHLEVLADRTDVPGGVGYALENRNITLRLFPSLFRDSQVHRLALYFRALRETIRDVGPTDTANPRVVILTSGPRDEAYFEHSYLAAYMGWNLVEGTDLTVRDGNVYIRALSGLERVHVIVRRIPSRWCDPLELRPDSTIGVPGLLSAARRGNVTVINPFGTGVIESPAFLASFDAIARHFLGREPLLPTVESWWCGAPESLTHVIAHLDELVLKPVVRSAEPMVFGDRLSEQEREQWGLRLAVEGRRWVAQRIVRPTTTPTLHDGELVPSPVILRTHLVAAEQAHVAMPGGLARVPAEHDDSVWSSVEGAISKDTWIISDEPVRDVPLWHRIGGPLDVEVSVPSRAAENLFWLGRYSERIEQKIRLLRVIHRRDQDLVDSVGGADVACVRALTGALGVISDVAFDEQLTSGTADTNALRRALGGGDNPASIRSEVRAVIDVAHRVRDLLSWDTWQIIGDLEGAYAELGDLDAVDLFDFERATVPLAGVAKSFQALAGLSNESFVRDDAWRFLDSGRRLERASLLVAILSSTLATSLGDAADDLLFESVLVQGDSIMTYRARHRGGLDLEAILRLLLFDVRNPRSVRHAVQRLGTNLDGLRTGPDPDALRPDQQRTLRLITDLRLADPLALAQVDATGARTALAGLLGALEAELRGVSSDLAAHFFIHLQRPTTVFGTQAGAEG